MQEYHDAGPLPQYQCHKKVWALKIKDVQLQDASGTGYHKDDPAWLAVWLLIAADNTLHLAINYASLLWL